MRKKAKSKPAWAKYEVRKARERRIKHAGGPGKPDAQRGRKKEEYKDWNRPVYKSVLVKAKRRGIKTVVAKKGFTEPALKYGKEKGMKLYKGRKRVR